MKRQPYSPDSHDSRLIAPFLSFVALVLGCMALLVSASPAHAGGSNVAATKHNLSASGPGTVKTASNRESCGFCHTPHAANPIAPLWNRSDPGTYYQTYDSSTLVANVGQPTGSSRLCLSCHDGTIALTQTYNPKTQISGGAVYISSQDRGYLGTDLSDDHPISFTYDATLAVQKGQLRDPSALPPEVQLDKDHRLQCTTCHDPHDDSKGKFLRLDNTNSKLCASCHSLNDWQITPHALSTASLNTASKDAWTNLSVSTVANAGCESCHRPHTAGGRQRLLRHEAEESNCINCHDGTVAKTNIALALQQLSTHASDKYTGVHDPKENTVSMSAHVECADCHAPHRIGAGGNNTAPNIRPSMYGASGVTSAGLKIAEARFEYEVCYKCHAANNFSKTQLVNRVLGSNDIAKEFAPANASFHPVEVAGRNMDVPSLIQPLTTTSVIYCTDCHTSNNPSSVGKGPHGSQVKPLLVAAYTTGDNVTESAQAYALCYKCHSRSSILGNTTFKRHKKHIVDEKTPCSVCHDSHGVRENSNLINFDSTVVKPASNGQGPTWKDLGNRKGSCTLRCHGDNHNNESY